MSVLVVMKISGDTATFRKAMAERTDELQASAARAKDAAPFTTGSASVTDSCR
jgi:hypothetical protein